MADIVNSINKRFVRISNRVTKAYEGQFSLPCDIYYPIFPPYTDKTKYRDMKIFTPHQSPTYAKKPDLQTKFYIPFLIPKQAMNSSEAEFDSFFTEDIIDRPFIETSKKRELPIASKIVVHQGQSIIKFFVDKKLVVTGADGMMLLRMYLSPLAKDEDGEIEEQEETTEEYKVETKVPRKPYVVKNDTGTTDNNAATMQDLESGFTMNIPDEDD